MIRELRTDAPDFEAAFARLCARQDAPRSDEVRKAVEEIIQGVAARGDEALLEHTARLDDRPGVTAADLEVKDGYAAAARSEIGEALFEALERTARRIQAFHEAQRSRIADTWHEDRHGVRAGLVAKPLGRVGIYVPGGTAAYPSTVLMNAIPAKVAGVRELIMVTPAKGGRVPAVVLAAASLAGVDRVFGIGGAQAVAALALGTATVPRVDKIVGPGNAYVTEAKRQLYGKVAIDQIAGPSEVLIIADDRTPREMVAADMLAQAEHDVDSACVLLTTSERLALAVAEELMARVAALPRREIVEKVLAGAQSAIVVVRSLEEAINLANRYAPEHLGLSVTGAEALAEKVVNAGAVFVGTHAAEALGDYNAGTNHVLPTGGTARFSSALSIHDFVKRSSVLEVSPAALIRIGADAALIARAEGLEAHAQAVEVRIDHTNRSNRPSAAPPVPR